MWQQQLDELKAGNIKTLARCISHVENESEEYESLLQALPSNHIPVIGITGPPGAGKSTLTDGLIGSFISMGKKVAVLCIDPSSPFNLGALLGDRIRMSEWYNNPDVFIRSLATRGSLGGLHPKIIEVTDLVKAAAFDLVVIETVGVGQSEIEIAGLADATVVVLVPESGDEVQSMKAGLMEIADIFVVNKSDRPGADLFVKNLRSMANREREIPVIKTVASQKEGVENLIEEILKKIAYPGNDKRSWLLAEKAYYLIQKKRMKDIDKNEIRKRIEGLGDFNMYRFVESLRS